MNDPAPCTELGKVDSHELGIVHVADVSNPVPIIAVLPLYVYASVCVKLLDALLIVNVTDEPILSVVHVMLDALGIVSSVHEEALISMSPAPYGLDAIVMLALTFTVNVPSAL